MSGPVTVPSAAAPSITVLAADPARAPTACAPALPVMTAPDKVRLAMCAPLVAPNKPRFAAAEVIEERFPSRAPVADGMEFGDQVAQVDTVPGMENTKAADRRKLPVDRRRHAVVIS